MCNQLLFRFVSDRYRLKVKLRKYFVFLAREKAV
uniref:Uncharacterized protein n=1 Tax=Anguilla anguilla TaxID=7936 RepID=A0A0E9R3D1_ANGAN